MKTMRTVRWIGAGAAVTAIAGLGYAARTWYRYGRVPKDEGSGLLLDRFMPDYEARERHEVRVAAPVAFAYAAAREMDILRSPLVRGVFRGRELLMGVEHADAASKPMPLIDQVLTLGWRILAEEPGREIVLGAVTRPWEPTPRFESVPSSDFAAFAEPGYVKIAWNLLAEASGPENSMFRTETRVMATDPVARRRFRRYWAMVSPGIVLIRRESLRLVRGEAERRYRAERDCGVPVAMG
jgi:hypothetical protein